MNRIRLATLLLPPLGLALLWREREFKLGRKLLGTLVALLYSIPYAAGMVWLLMQFTPLEIEWRGGFPPVLTFAKTRPDYQAVEAHRAKQTNQVPLGLSGSTGGSSAYWTDFRGPHRDGHYAERPILGRRQWKDGRYGYGQLLLASGHLVVLSGEGELALVRANSDRHEELARFQALQGKTWNHPAIADSKVLVRNAVEMACYEIGAPGAAVVSPGK